MYKTIVNFRNDFGKKSIDSSLTRKWDATAVDTLTMLKGINPSLDLLEQYSQVPEYEGMKQMAHAFKGMSMRRACDSAIDGPYILDHEEPELSDKFLIDWWRAQRKRRR